jgi:hypothetical protein
MINRTQLCRLAGALAWAAAAVTQVLIVTVDVESVVVMGPVIFLLGVATIVSSRRSRYPRAAWLGVAHVGVCVLFVALVNVFDWSPRDAEWPFGIMGGRSSSRRSSRRCGTGTTRRAPTPRARAAGAGTRCTGCRGRGVRSADWRSTAPGRAGSSRRPRHEGAVAHAHPRASH